MPPHYQLLALDSPPARLLAPHLLPPTSCPFPTRLHTHRDTMVFETLRDIDVFTERCRDANIMIHNRLLALDGSAYNSRPVRLV